MHAGHGLALLLGVLIGDAILLDDVITPERKGPPPRVAMLHHGDEFDDPRALSPSGDYHVWVIEGDDPVETEIHKEIRIELESLEKNVYVAFPELQETRDQKMNFVKTLEKIRKS